MGLRDVGDENRRRVGLVGCRPVCRAGRSRFEKIDEDDGEHAAGAGPGETKGKCKDGKQLEQFHYLHQSTSRAAYVLPRFEAGVLDFVEQGLVADAKNLCRLPSIPLHAL